MGKRKRPYEAVGPTGMRYRLFGRTGWYISVVAGNESFPAPVAERAMMLGVNYWHKAQGIRHLPELIRKHNARKWTMVEFCIDPGKSKAQIVSNFKRRMSALGYEYVDWFKMHVRWDDTLFEAFQDLKGEGLVRWLSVSFHAKPQDVRRYVDSGAIDAVQIMVNPTSGREVRELCSHCLKKGVGVIAMKTMAGGPRRWAKDPRLVKALKKHFPDIKSIPQAIVKFVLSIPGVSSVVVACRNFDQLRDTVLGAGMKLTATERRGLEALGAALRAEFCELCGECELACPKGLPVREILRMELYLVAYEDRRAALEVYKSLPRRARPEVCDLCGLCETRCPRGIPVVERIRAVIEALV